MEPSEPSDPLANIGFISLKDQASREIAGFQMDLDIPLPMELPPERENWRPETISWEAIIAGILKVLAYRPAHEHADYYRRFVLAVRPDIKSELTEAGILKARNGDFDLAIAIFRALEGLLPDSADTMLNLALVFEDKARKEAQRDGGGGQATEQDTERAFQAYKRALEVDPLFPQAHYNLAYFYLQQKNFEGAKEHLDAFLQHSNPEDFPDQREKARRISREIESWGQLDALFKKAFDAIQMGQEERGIENIQEFLRHFPKSWNAWFILGWGYRRLGRYREGKEAFLKSLAIKGDQPDTLNELAICLMELGEMDESYRKLKAALQLEPENTKVISNLGVLSMKRGNREEAAGFFRCVLEIDPQDPLAQRYLLMLSPNPE
jgi:tetratricopeptide (TPR) repeat protein